MRERPMDDDDLEEAETIGRMGVGNWPSESSTDLPTVTPTGSGSDAV